MAASEAERGTQGVLFGCAFNGQWAMARRDRSRCRDRGACDWSVERELAKKDAAGSGAQGAGQAIQQRRQLTTLPRGSSGRRRGGGGVGGGRGGGRGGSGGGQGTAGQGRAGKGRQGYLEYGRVGKPEPCRIDAEARAANQGREGSGQWGLSTTKKVPRGHCVFPSIPPNRPFMPPAPPFISNAIRAIPSRTSWHHVHPLPLLPPPARPCHHPKQDV